MVDMETPGDRLRAERIFQGKRQEDAAQAAGVTKQAISNIERGVTKDASAATLEPIARSYGLSLQWVLSGKGPKYAGESASDADWPDVLGYRQAASLGPGAVPDEYAETHKLKFRADSLRKKHLRPDRLGVVYGKGDSMLPRIRSGDAILFDMADTEPKDGALYVISYKGDLLAKRLSLLGGRWFIESLNQNARDYRKPQPIDEFEHFKIHGRVRWIGSWED